MSGIYRIVLTDGRSYVGQSVDIRRRWHEHRSRANRGKHWLPYFQNCWNKYGVDAFQFEVLETCPHELLTEREQWWMDKLHPVFNVAPIAGTIAGYKRPFRNLTPAHRAKISAANRTRYARLRAERAAVAEPAAPTKMRLEIHYWKPPRRRVRFADLPVEEQARRRQLKSERISAAKKGKPSPHRGKPSPLRGRKQSPELIAKRAAALKGHKGHYAGKTLSAEHRAKIAASKMGKKPTEAHRASLRAGQQRRHERTRAQREAQQLLEAAA